MDSKQNSLNETR